MAENQPKQESVPATASTVVTVTEAENQDVPAVRLKLRKPKTDRKVNWTNDTVDNEHMNKKKSKCCCIYRKPSKFGESSSSDSDDECEHCLGHVEKKKKNQQGSTVQLGGATTAVIVVAEPSEETTNKHLHPIKYDEDPVKKDEVN